MPTKKVTRKASKKVSVRRKAVPKSGQAKKVAQKVTKKTTSKKTVKKTVKKMVPKKGAARFMKCANEECSFWTTDGQVLSNLQDLGSALQSMQNDVFAYHVTKQKNDFAEWVEHVLDDTACAKDLRKSRKAKSAQTVVIRHIRLYTA